MSYAKCARAFARTRRTARVHVLSALRWNWCNPGPLPAQRNARREPMKNLLITTTALGLLFCGACNIAEAKTAKAFIEEGIQGDNSEVMLGQLASQKGASSG